jgi:hypothetical protein
MIDYAKESEIVRIQRANKGTDVFSGKSFESIRNNTDEGLGFDDMISIDQDKLKKAFGGNLDQKALEKEIRKTGDAELKKLTKQDSAEKIEKDVTAAVTDGCNGINDYIIQQYRKDPEKFTLDDDLITTALGENLDTGKHKAAVNPMLKLYAEGLKAGKDKLTAAMTVAADPATAEKVRQAGIEEAQKAAADQIMEFLKDTAVTREQVIQLLSEGGDAEKLNELTGGVLPEETVKEISGVISTYNEKAGEAAVEKLPGPEEVLTQGLAEAAGAVAGQKKLKDGIKEYAQGIEAMQMAQEVYPALGKVAATIGSKFKVDASLIADAFQMKMDEDEITRLITAYVSGGQETNYDSNLRKLGYADLANPMSMSFYLKDFESKENFLKYIDDYNQEMQDKGNEDMVISYTDITGVMIKSVKTITNAVSYVLIAFVAISLIVSSIMIGVITYISVLERTKEICILRAIGASKKDISRIFNAETIIVGLCAGVIGIGASLLLLIPINRILFNLTKIASLKAILPPEGAVILILISIFLTFIAGLIPSGMAARKDPVVALRTE